MKREEKWFDLFMPIALEYLTLNPESKGLNPARGKRVHPGACTIKLLTAVIYRFSQKARVFVPGKPFQPSPEKAFDVRTL